MFYKSFNFIVIFFVEFKMTSHYIYSFYFSGVMFLMGTVF